MSDPKGSIGRGPRWCSASEPTCQCRSRGKANSVRALKDPLEKEMATHSSTLAWEIPWTGAWQVTVHEATKSDTSEHAHTHRILNYIIR